MQSWDDIKIFLAVVRAGTVSGASHILKVNQSTISRRINAFEESLKVRLFERFSTGYTLTAEGETLLSHAQRIEEETLAIERKIAGSSTADSGPIRVTTSVFLTHYLLMPIFKKFILDNPDVELQIDASNTDYNLARREADVAIRLTRDRPPENLVGRQLGSIPFSVYGDKKYLDEYINSQQNASLFWVGEDKQDSRPDWLSENFNSLRLTLRCNDALVTVEAIKSGLGVGRLPSLVGVTETGLKPLANMPVPDPVPLWILTHQEMRKLKRVSQFISSVSDAIRESLSHL